MAPKLAYEALVANIVDYVPLATIRGRIAATLALIYPPGTGVVLPGERWTPALSRCLITSSHSRSRSTGTQASTTRDKGLIGLPNANGAVRSVCGESSVGVYEACPSARRRQGDLVARRGLVDPACTYANPDTALSIAPARGR